MKKSLYRLTCAAILAALSIVLNVFFRTIIPNDLFGIPLFALPLIIGSILLGPFYGGVMGLTVDVISFSLIGTGNFLFLFTLSRIVWGALPGLFYLNTNLKSKKIVLVLGIFLTHVTVTGLNTLALFIHFNSGAFATLPLRIIMVTPNVVFLSFMTNLIMERLPKEYLVDLGFNKI